MVKQEHGFTLVELMITMVMFLLVIIAASNVFTGLLTQFKQQSKIAETNIEGAVSLEMLRRDIESAGYGLPWNVTGVVDADGDGDFWEHVVSYCEAVSDLNVTPNPTTFNDGSSAFPCPLAVTNGSAPRAIISGDDSGVNFSAVAGGGADYLAIKATNVANNATAQKWTYLNSDGTKTTWSPACENLNKYATTGDTDCSTGASTENTVRVMVISPGAADANSRALVVNGAFFTQYSNTGGFFDADPTTKETRMIYGVDRNTDLRMPFNRVDYYIKRPATAADMPSRCAPNTGILYRATLNQSNGQLLNMPILDCVADMQVVYGLDTDNDGVIDSDTDTIAGLTAQQIRAQVKRVAVYILAHEGQMDASYTSPATILVGPDAILGHNFDFGTNINYRWKVYTLFVRPNNLR
ncbi:MAG: hypothetical protein A2Z09_04280 [Nitrospirae bacterium RBG_16_43_8]|nr:MAG: hypothetical protein A2Z09_04280 [Nitrospirae bacterium RBG_16_43_8]